MQTKKNLRLWLVVAMLFMAGGMRAAESEGTLCVIYLDGNYIHREVYFLLETNPQVVFDNEDITITSTQTQSVFQVDNVVEMYFLTESPILTKTEGDISDTSASGKVVFRILADDVVRVTGSSLRPETSVYTSDGKSVEVPVVYSEHEINIRLGNLPRGLYIVKTNQQTFKFIRK